MRAIITAVVLMLGIAAAAAQNAQLNTAPLSGLITTGGTLQVLSAANVNRRSLQIQNNNTTTDNCWVTIGGPWQVGDTAVTTRTVNGFSMTYKQAGALLSPGGSYTRYTSSFVPLDQVLITCASNGNSYYADIQ